MQEMEIEKLRQELDRLHTQVGLIALPFKIFILPVFSCFLS